MSTDSNYSTGRRIPAAAFQNQITDTAAAQNQAQRLISDAQKQAEEIIENARESAASQYRMLEELGEAELEAFINQDRLSRHAKLFVTLLNEVNTIRESHHEMLPWLVELVQTSLNRIIGEMDKTEATARFVRQAVRELHDTQVVRLLVHPENYEELCQARVAYPELMEAVVNITTDIELPLGELKLVCKIGSTQTSIAACLDRVLDIIATTPSIVDTTRAPN